MGWLKNALVGARAPRSPFDGFEIPPEPTTMIVDGIEAMRRSTLVYTYVPLPRSGWYRAQARSEVHADQMRGERAVYLYCGEAMVGAVTPTWAVKFAPHLPGEVSLLVDEKDEHVPVRIYWPASWGPLRNHVSIANSRAYQEALRPLLGQDMHSAELAPSKSGKSVEVKVAGVKLGTVPLSKLEHATPPYTVKVSPSAFDEGAVYGALHFNLPN